MPPLYIPVSSPPKDSSCVVLHPAKSLCSSGRACNACCSVAAILLRAAMHKSGRAGMLFNPGIYCNAFCPAIVVISVFCRVQLGKGKRNFSKLQRQVDTQREKRELNERERKELNEIKRLIPDRLSDPLLDVGMHMAYALLI